MRKIYFDHSATTPVDSRVMAAMRPYFSRHFGNASSLHGFGQRAEAAVDRAREQTAEFLNCEAAEIVFTSGATEADNLAIKGLINALRGQGRKNPHIITTAAEHDAVLEPCRELAKSGVKLTVAKIMPDGTVDLAGLANAIREDTVLISVMHANSEVGTVNPAREIGKLVKKARERRRREWEKRRPAERSKAPCPIYFHTDAVQAVNFFNCDVKWNYIDLLSLSGHKIYGPKGAGALYARTGVPLSPLLRGGGHERGWRSGTLNVPGIAGLGAALNLLGRGEKGEPGAAQKKNNEKIARLRDRLADGLLKTVPDAVLNTDRSRATPAHAHFSFLGVEGESILIALDLEGIAVSTGSACASGSLEASHVLLAMGISAEVAHNSVRFTLGKNNTQAEVDRLLKILPPIVARLRKMNPDY